MARAAKPTPPKLLLGTATFVATVLSVVGIVAGVLTVLFPDQRTLFWLTFAICMGGLVGLFAYYFLERQKMGAHGRTLIASVGIAVAGTFVAFLGGQVFDGGMSPDFSKVPAKRGVLKLAFYGGNNVPSEAGDENLFRHSVACSTVSIEGAKSLAGPWSPPTTVQNCIIVAIWRRPIKRQVQSLTLNGSPITLTQPSRESSPYVTEVFVSGVPMVGLVELRATEGK